MIEELFGYKARVKIIRLLALNGELNISRIIREANLNHANVNEHLKYLEKEDLIQEKGIFPSWTKEEEKS